MTTQKKRVPQEASRLWTIQTKDQWLTAQRTRVVQADGRRVYHYMRPAYRWMMRQMKLRLLHYSGRYPIWAWHTPKPDLRCVAHLPPGTPGVRIEFWVLDDKILLSNFEAWHAVLNRDYLSYSEADDNEFTERLKTARHNPAIQTVLQREIEASWERVFELDALQAHPDWWGPCDIVQATTEQVTLDRIITVDHFIAR